MGATADMIMERRRERRRLTFWRVLAIVAIVVAVLAFLPRPGTVTGDHIARVSIDGIIFDDPRREKRILQIADDDDVKAMIVRVSSPGGTVVASEALYLALRKVAEKKPVVAVMSEYAASGGYIAAIAGDHIVSRGNTLTGSIGVVMEAPNVAGLLDMVGVEVTRIKSAPLKAEPSMTTKPSPEALRAQEELIADTFAWFTGLVEDRRGLTGEALERVIDGRAFTGRQALELSLVDAIGDEDTALDWLAAERDIDRDLTVLEWSWAEEELPWPLSVFRKSALSLNQASALISSHPRLYALIQ